MKREPKCRKKNLLINIFNWKGELMNFCVKRLDQQLFQIFQKGTDSCYQQFELPTEKSQVEIPTEMISD